MKSELLKKSVTWTVRITGLIVMSAYLLLGIACGNNGGSSSRSPVTNPSAYHMVNGNTCVNAAGQAVQTNFCTQNGYYPSNGLCYSANGQQVANSYCVTGNNYNGNYNGGYNTGYGNGGSQVCYGTYIYYSGGMGSGAQYAQCNGGNCSGYTLYTSTGQPVYCQ